MTIEGRAGSFVLREKEKMQAQISPATFDNL